jgi:hypothetical protein
MSEPVAVVPYLKVERESRVRMRVALTLSQVTGLPYTDPRVENALARAVSELVQDTLDAGMPGELVDSIMPVLEEAVEDEAVSMYQMLHGSVRDYVIGDDVVAGGEESDW